MALLFRRIHASLDRIDGTIERNTRAFDDLQVVIRADRIRGDRTLHAVERSYEGMMRSLDKLALAIDELRQESREHTSAIRSMMDRLGEGPTPAS